MDDVKDHELTKDVKNFINNNIKDVKSVEDVVLLGNFKIKESYYDKEARSYQELLRFKKNLQLVINSFNNFEMYKDLHVKIVDDNEKLLERDNDMITGRIIRQPDDSVMAKALFNYILCYLSITMEEESTGTVNIGEINNCTFCDNNINDDETGCGVCGASIYEIKEDFIKKKKVQDKKKDILNNKSNESESNEMLVKMQEEKEKENIDEMRTSKKIMMKQDDTNKWKCEQCGLLNEYTNINCGACGEVYKEGIWTCGRCTTENDCTSDHCRGCRSRNNNIKIADDDHGGRDNNDAYYGAQDGGGMIDGDVNMVDVSGGDNNMADRRGCDDWMKDEANVKKWKCGACGLLNEYSALTCTACYGLYKDGRWICGQCTVGNSGDKDYCSVCNERNVNNIYTSGGGQTGAERVIDVSYKSALEVDNIEGKSDIVDRDKETHIPVDEWRCVCTTRQSYKYTVCQTCNRGRDVSGEWMCTKCTMVNKCNTDNCTACNEWNNNLPKKKCQYCWVNKVNGPKIRCEDCVRKKIGEWKCGNRKCRRENDYNVEYCWFCYYWRHNTYGRGDECKQKGRLYGTNNGWICAKCDTFNDLNKTDCSKSYCKETRYGETLLDNKDNDGMKGVGRGIGGSHKDVLVGDNIDGKSDIVDRDKETHIPVDEWRCVCTTRQSYKYTVCDVCGRSRGVSGEWMCAKCTTINKCDIDKCSTCNEWNDNLPIKLCVFCKKNRVTGTDIRCKDCATNTNNQWKCGYSNCGIMNRNNDEYCWKCNFWRYNIYDHGDKCKRKGSYGRINNVWICNKCDTVNDLTKTYCSKYNCSETRYLKI